MKKLKYILPLFLVFFAALACSEVEETHVGKTFTAPVLNTHENIVIDATNLDAGNATFKWEAADYGYQAAPEYVLWGKALVEGEKDMRMGGIYGNDLEISYSMLNSLLMRMGSEMGETQEMTLYLTSSISVSYLEGVLKSNAIALNITTYKAPVTELPGPLKMPGNHQGWSPMAENIPKLFAKDMFGNYEGLADLTNPGGETALEFKFLDGADWGAPDWGSNDETSYSPVYKGQGNIKAIKWGYYLMTFQDQGDDSAIVTTLAITTIGLVGDAFPAVGWSENDTLALIYDKATNTWSVETTVAEGGFKIRSNNSGWDNLWGSETGGMDDIKYGSGDNINVDATYVGTKKVTLHLDKYPYYITITNP